MVSPLFSSPFSFNHISVRISAVRVDICIVLFLCNEWNVVLRCIRSSNRQNFALIWAVDFPSVLWHCWLGDRTGFRPVKKLDVGLLVVMTWLELCTTYGSSSPVDLSWLSVSCFGCVNIFLSVLYCLYLHCWATRGESAIKVSESSQRYRPTWSISRKCVVKTREWCQSYCIVWLGDRLAGLLTRQAWVQIPLAWRESLSARITAMRQKVTLYAWACPSCRNEGFRDIKRIYCTVLSGFFQVSKNEHPDFSCGGSKNSIDLIAINLTCLLNGRSGQWRRAHWARSGLGPTLNMPSRARSG